MQTPTAESSPDITITVFGYASPASGQTVLAERCVTARALRDGSFAAELDARAGEEGWRVSHLCRRTPEDVEEYEELLKLAAEAGLAKAPPAARALLERFLTGEVAEDLLFAMGRAVREGGIHPSVELALKAAERDVYRVFWRVHLGPVGVHALLREAETWAGMALDWSRA
jgi:hypothetical protein